MSKNIFNEKYIDNKVSKIRRGGATIVDWYISTLIGSIPILYMYSVESGKTGTPPSLTYMSTDIGVMAGVLGIILISLYYIAIPLKKNKGQTLGKRIFGIKVVQENGDDVTAKVLFKRELLGVLLIEGGLISSSKYFREIFLLFDINIVYQILATTAIIMPFISITIMILNKNSKMIHDFIAGTQVVQLMEQ